MTKFRPSDDKFMEEDFLRQMVFSFGIQQFIKCRYVIFLFLFFESNFANKK